MATRIYDDYDPAYDEPDLKEGFSRRKRRSQKYQWEEDRTLADYIAATPEGQRRFTNIPGQGEDTFFMPEASMQAPVGMESRATYGDPYAETRSRAEALEAEGRPVDIEGIYTGVRDEFSRRDEGIRNELGLRQAMMLKHGPPKAPKQPDMGALVKLVQEGVLTPGEAKTAAMQGFRLGPMEKIAMPDEDVLAGIETKQKGLSGAARSVKKKEAKQRTRTLTKGFMFMGKAKGKKPRGWRQARSRYPLSVPYNFEDDLSAYRYGEYGR